MYTTHNFVIPTGIKLTKKSMTNFNFKLSFIKKTVKKID